MSVLYNFGGGTGSGGGDYVDNRTIQEITASGLSEDPGQVLVEGVDGGALLTGPGIQAALDASLGGPEWRQGGAERLLTYDVPSRTVGILAGTGVALPLATTAEAGLMSAADKQALAAASGGAGGVATEMTRAQIALTAIEAGVASLRTNGYAAPGDGGGGLYARAGAEPAHGGKVQSADGAWWELVAEGGAVNILQFGAVRRTDGGLPTVDAQAAVAAALAFARLWTDGTTGRGLTVAVPAGRYLIGQPLEIRAALRLLGAGAARFDFADTAGLLVHSATSLGVSGVESPDNPATSSAEGAVIAGLHLAGPEAGAGFDASKPGVKLHARAALSGLRVEGFSGHGVEIAPGLGAEGWRIDGLTAQRNGGSGLAVLGAGADRGTATALDLAENGRYGLEDRADAGSAYLGLALRGNGTAAAGQGGATALVARAGALYAAAPGASEAALSATEPGTDPAVWAPTLPGIAPDPARAPDWQAGQPAGTYAPGGAALLEGAGNAAVLTGAEVTPDQPPLALGPAGVLLGGRSGAPRAAAAGLGRALGASSERAFRALAIRSPAADTTLAAADAFALLRFTGAAAQVLTVPAGALAVGDQVSLTQAGAGAVTVAAGAGVTLETEASLTLRGQHAAASLLCVAPDTYLLIGGLAAS